MVQTERGSTTSQCVENSPCKRLGKDKGKVLPTTGHEGPEGSRGVDVLFLKPRH